MAVPAIAAGPDGPAGAESGRIVTKPLPFG